MTSTSLMPHLSCTYWPTAHCVQLAPIYNIDSSLLQPYPSSKESQRNDYSITSVSTSVRGLSVCFIRLARLQPPRRVPKPCKSIYCCTRYVCGQRRPKLTVVTTSSPCPAAILGHIAPHGCSPAVDISQPPIEYRLIHCHPIAPIPMLSSTLSSPQE